MKANVKYLFLILALLLTGGLSPNSYAQCDFSSDFESGTLTDWTVVAGTNVVSTQQVHTGNYALKMTLSGGYPKILSNQSNFDFGEYTAWYYLTETYAAGYIQFHYQDANNYYQLGMVPQGTWNPGLVLVKRVAGTNTILANIPPVFPQYTWFKMTVDRIQNGDIIVKINDSIQFSVNDLSLTLPGKVTIAGYDYTTYFDDFCYTAIPSNYLINLGSDVYACEGDSVQLNAGGGLLNYVWNGGLVSGSTLNVATSGTYYVQAVDPAGIAYSDTIIVTIYANPIVDLGNDTTICPYDTLNLNTGSTGYNYLWSTGETSENIIVVPATSTAYNVFAAINGCITSDTMQVTVIDSITVTLIDDTVICGGTSIILYPSGNGGSYTWSTDQSSDSIIVSSTGMYAVTATNMCGFTSEDSVYVQIYPIPYVNLGNTLSFCTGDSLLISSNVPSSSYLWSTGDSTQAIQVNNPGYYSVVVSNICGTAFDTVFVNELSPPLVNLSDTIICQWDTLTLNSQNPGNSYLWSTGDTSQILLVSPLTTSNYAVTVSNAACSSSDAVFVEVLPLPLVMLGNDLTICENDTVSLDAGNVGASFSWSNGATDQTIEIFPQVSQQVWVSVSLAGCESADSIMVNIFAEPVAQLGNDSSFCVGSNLILNAGNPGLNYLWSTGETTQQIIITNPGYYSVWIENQCMISAEDTIWIAQNALPVIDLGQDTILNIGESLVLNAGSGFHGYLWSDNSSASSILLDSLNLTPGFNEIVLLITDSNSCSSSDTLIVNYTESQTINLPQGWSIISTYIDPVDPDVIAVMSNLNPNLIIAKNEAGLIYWPLYNLNTIGSMVIGDGYQIKMLNPQVLQVIGTIITPELTPFTISQGWNIIGYLRTSPALIDVMLSSIESNIIIVKNSNGLIYWPFYGLNVIGNMNPGEGYQIKMMITVTLLYPAN